MKFDKRKFIRKGMKVIDFHFIRQHVSTLSLLFVFTPLTSFAQGYIEGANISYEFSPLKIKTPEDDQTFSSHNVKVGTTVPIFLTPNHSKYLLVGGNFEAFDFVGSHIDFPVERTYSISPTIGYSTMIGKKLNLTALFMPTLNSDYKDVKGSDIKLGGIVRASWKSSETLTWKATLGYRQQFYGPLYIVLLGMDWKVNEKWRIFGDFPHSATVSYALNDKVNTGFNLTVQNTTYRLEYQKRYFEYNSVNPGLFAEFYISPNWAVRATASYSLIRDMEVYNEHDKADGFIDFYEMGNRKDPINPEVSSGLAFKVGLSYRIFPGKK
jgi:hypothetical protein